MRLRSWCSQVKCYQRTRSQRFPAVRGQVAGGLVVQPMLNSEAGEILSPRLWW